MELDEMKSHWEAMTSAMEKQKKLTNSIIIKMTQSNFNNKVRGVMIPEVLSSFICLGWIIYVLLQFQKLDTWYLQACGIVTVLILIVLPVLSLRGISKMRSVNIIHNTYRQSLIAYSKGRMQFVFAQKLSFYLTPLLMVAMLSVSGKLFGGGDFFKKPAVWYFYLLMLIPFYFFATWVLKKYMKMTKDAENILKELDTL